MLLGGVSKDSYASTYDITPVSYTHLDVYKRQALGLTKMQTYLYVIIPQAVRRLIPLSINLITRMIKTTSLILMIDVYKRQISSR